MGNGYASMSHGCPAHIQTRIESLNLQPGIRAIKSTNSMPAGKRVPHYQPDVLSILIGVNDIWHGLNGRYDGTVETYENDYRALLQRTRKALPKVQLVICEPFVLRCGAVNDKWFPEFDHYRAAARKVADEHSAVFVPFQSMFDQALQFAPANHWAGDGVHPSSHGAALMADFWLQAVRG